MQNLRLFIGLLALLVTLGTSVLGQQKEEGSTLLKAELTGAAEAPNPGDPDGYCQLNLMQR